MTKRWRAAAAFAAGLVLVGLAILAYVAVVALITPMPLVTRAEYDSISLGMTRAELEAVLGPPRNELKSRVTIWAPQSGGAIVSAEVSPGTPDLRFFPTADVRDQDRELVWLSKSGLIAASFDEQGLLRDKYFSTVHDAGKPTVMDWLRSRKDSIRPVVEQR